MTDIAEEFAMSKYASASDRCTALMDEITRLRKERGELISQFHHAMKDAGWHPGRTDDNLCDIIRDKGKLLAATESNMEFYRNFAAEVLAIKRLPIPQDMEAMCRRAYDNQYHKIKADIGYDQWRTVWIKAIAAHEADIPYSSGPLPEHGWD